MTASTVRLGAVCFGVFAFVFLADFMFASHRFTSRAVLSPHAAVSAFVDQQRPDAGGFAKRVLKADAEQQQQRPLDPSLHGDYRRAKMDDYTSKRTAQCDEGGGWQSVDMPRSGIFATSLYGNRTVKPESGYPEEERYVGLQVCETFDDASEESGWKIYRIGPMVGMGGSDWHQVWLHPIPHPEQAKFITGKVTGPVDERGNFLGHPPIYSHHVHVEVNGVQVRQTAMTTLDSLSLSSLSRLSPRDVNLLGVSRMKQRNDWKMKKKKPDSFVSLLCCFLHLPTALH